MEVIILIMALVFGAALLLVLFCIGSIAKDKEPRNKVHFYVKRGHGNRFTLWVGKTISSSFFVFADWFFKYFNLNPDDFADMKEGEIREVFINLED